MPVATAFRGQQPNEPIVLLARPYPLWVAGALWPVALGVAALLILLWAQAALPVWRAAWGMLAVVVGAGTLVAFVCWAWQYAYHWWFTLAIVTDRRVIAARGGITASTAEIPLAKIQSISVAERSLLQWLCNVGDVVVDAAGAGTLTLLGLHRPNAIVRLIFQTRDALAAATPRASVADPDLRSVLAGLAQPEPLPAALPVDPRLTTHWPLRRAVNVPLLAGEDVLGVISRHWWSLAQRAAWPAAILTGTVVLSLVGVFAQSPLGVVEIAGVVVGLVWAALSYLNFADDVFLLTSRRVIDVERHFFIFYETQLSIEYAQIQEVALDVPSALARALGFGDVIVASAGRDPLRMTTVPHPDLVAAAIESNRQAFKRHSEIAAVNARKDDLQDWFAAVLTELVAGAPDLRGKSLTEAMVAAQDVGLRVLAMGELAIPGVRAGVVISQNPLPGARCLRGGDVAVLLSRM